MSDMLNALTNVMNLAYKAKFDLYNDAEDFNKPVQICLHWTAGWGYTLYNDYHICITKDGAIHVMQEDFSRYLPHNYCKNHASIGIALCCCAGADSNDLGEEPPTEEQIDTMEQVIAVISEALKIPIDVEHVPTHGESADNMDYTIYFPEHTGYRNNTYGPNSNCERWDLQYLGTDESPEYIADHSNPHTGGNVIREHALVYRKKFYGH